MKSNGLPWWCGAKPNSEETDGDDVQCYSERQCRAVATAYGDDVWLLQPTTMALSSSLRRVGRPSPKPVEILCSPPIPPSPPSLLQTPGHPPYVLSWLNSEISAQNMMDQELFEKLVLNNFCKLATAFQKGGLRDRNGSFFYKDHIRKSNVPVLAVAGDQDLICSSKTVQYDIKVLFRTPSVCNKDGGDGGIGGLHRISTGLGLGRPTRRSDGDCNRHSGAARR
ncbi:hypothetical protein RIF29_22126 [Crotalaria pallida]|uniref:Uncharacterized protein n=1 Tax=Crotalaria pallida TaxID=3830 RepID=A0AAN9F8T0_CROPI